MMFNLCSLLLINFSYLRFPCLFFFQMSIEDFTMYGGAFGNKQDSVFPNLEARLFIPWMFYVFMPFNNESWNMPSHLIVGTELYFNVTCTTGGSDVLILPAGATCSLLACIQCCDWPAAGPIRDLSSVHGPRDAESAEAQRLLTCSSGVQAALRHWVCTPDTSQRVATTIMLGLWGSRSQSQLWTGCQSVTRHPGERQ